MIRTLVTTVFGFSSFTLPLLGAALLLVPPFAGAQSLGEVARQEAERRDQLDAQGVTEKVIDITTRNDSGAAAADALPTDDASARPAASKKKRSGAASTRDRASDDHAAMRSSASGERDKAADAALRRYRAALQKLDKSIRQKERTLAARERRREKARRAPPAPIRIGQTSRDTATATIQRLEEEIADIKAELRQLRDERANVYDEGRREGFLPGELEGRTGVW